MKKPTTLPLANTAVLTLADVKAAIEAFDRGDNNAFDAMDAVIFAVESYHAALQARRDAA
jgi:hypothetical protein